MEKKYLAIHTLTAARILFAKHWKDPENPSQEELIAKILDTAEIDKLSEWLDSTRKMNHEDCWHKFYDWLRNRINSIPCPLSPISSPNL